MKNKEEKKKILPEEKVRELMIKNGVDKANMLWDAWNEVARNFEDEKYFIPQGIYVARHYGKTPIKIVMGNKTSKAKTRYLPEETVVKLLIEAGIENESNITDFWISFAEEYNKNRSQGEELFPSPANTRLIRRLYNKTYYQVIFDKHGFNREYISKEDARDIMISSGIETCTNINESWDKIAKEYNANHDKCIPMAVSGSCKKIYKTTPKKLIFGFNGCNKPHPSLEFVINYMITNKIDFHSLYDSWKFLADKYNKSHVDKIPKDSRDIRKIYGIQFRSLSEIFSKNLINASIGVKTKKLISFLTLHIEDLAMMDKPELLQLGMLGDLPKEEHKKLIDYPKGKEKVEFIKEMIERLENPEETNQETETFDEFLDKDVDKSKETNSSKDETEFEKELHCGLELTKKPRTYDLKEQMSELFGRLDALSNFKDSDFTSEEAVDYIASYEIQKLWNIIICNPIEAMKLIEEQMLERGSSRFFGDVINEFLRQYNEVTNLKIPEGYSFPFQPTLMQKLTAHMVFEKRQTANWSETGSGKTLSGVLSSRSIDSRITFVIAVNSTINNWTDDAIKKAYPDSKVYRKNNITDTTILDRNFHNYVVVNYEEFQSSNKFLSKWKPFLENNKVDFVILDEIQKVKANSRDNMTNRRIVIENLLQEIDKKHGRDLEKEGRIVPVLALSATPVINSVNEGLSIISLLRGIDYTQKRNTRKSALACHFEIVKIGLRLIEEFPATEKLVTFPIKRDIKDISGINIEKSKSFLVAVDVCGCLIKIGECIRIGYLQKGIPTVIYTELVTDVIDPIIGYLQAFGFRVGEFTGRNEDTRETVKEDFISGKYDVLLASKPITTGVDGLQKVCNRIIPIVLPWTYAEYHQLIGRLNRKGTVFSEVEVIIPNIEYTNSCGDIWSLDNSRLARIHYKQILADVIMNGNIPDDIITKEQALKIAKDKFLEFIENNKHGEKTDTREIPVQAAELKPTTPKPRPEGQGNQRDYFSEFQGINQRISTSTFSGVFGKIFKNKEDWENYHDLAKKSRAFLNDNPLNTIVRDFLKSKKHKVLGDMGCGMNQLKTLLPENYEVISVDMFAADETVKVCNLMDTSSILPNESLDIAVYCLSLWSRDWRKIIEDAYRILDYDGKIIIVEPISSQSKSIDKVRQTLLDNGFINILTTKDGEEKFYYMTASK